MIDKFSCGFINSVYDFNDFTLNELICKLAQKMDEVITQSNESFNYLDWLKGEGLSDEVVKTLTEWEENGTLSKIINIDVINKLKIELDNIENNIDRYKDYVIDIGKETEDWQPAIQKALTEKNRVTLNDQIYKISRTITLNDNQSINGKGKNKTKIKLNNNENCTLLSLANNKVTGISISDLTLDGNRENQTAKNSVLEIINEFADIDYVHSINNINIIQSSGDGFVFKGRTGGSILTNIDIIDVNGDGLYTQCFDTAFNNCSVGHAKDGVAFLIDGANNRFTNCKVWGSLNGLLLKASRCTFNCIESQDNGIYGIKITGGMNSLTNVLCDSIGYRYKAGQPIFEPNAKSIIVEGYDNLVDGICIDRAEFSKTGSQHYALECNGGRNKVTLLAKDLLTDGIFGTPNKNNQIELISALNKENTGNVPNRFVNEINGIVNGDGFIITGDSDLSVIMPVINNEKQWTKTLEYNLSKDVYQFGTHVIPKGWSLDLGQPNNKWKSVWVREYLNIKNDENTSDITIGENVLLCKKAPLFIRGGEQTGGIIIDSDSNTLHGHSNGTWNLGTQEYIYNTLYCRDVKLLSPDGNTWSLSINNDGTVKTTKII